MNVEMRILAGMMGLILSGCAATAGRAAMNSATPAAGGADPACLAHTGTRISGNGANCAAPVRVYTDKDIQQSGATTVADALRLLDPAVTVRQ